MNRQRKRMGRYRSIGNGFYSSILMPWEEVYAPSELLVLQFETCVRQPETMLERTFDFLGVDGSYRPEPASLRTPVNKTKSKLDIDPELRNLLCQVYEREVASLANRYPEIDLRLWPNFARMLDRPSPISDTGSSPPAVGDTRD